MIDASALADFVAGFRGTVVQPDDADYEDVRALYNGMIDKRPTVIARCVDVADVMSAVNFGRDTGLRIAMRGGGHIRKSRRLETTKRRGHAELEQLALREFVFCRRAQTRRLGSEKPCADDVERNFASFAPTHESV